MAKPDAATRPLVKCHVGQLTKRESAYIQKLLALRGKRSLRVKQCWRNSQRLMICDDENRLRYWEGLMDSSIPHAWLTINGKVVDVTREAGQRKLKREGGVTDEHVPCYEGILINRRTVLWTVLRRKKSGPLASFYTFDGLLLEKGVLGDDFTIFEAVTSDPSVAKEPSTVLGCIPAAPFREFRQMREKLKKPLRGRALVEMVRKLKQLYAKGHDIGGLLNQSTRHRWEDVFPLEDTRSIVAADYAAGGMVSRKSPAKYNGRAQLLGRL